MSNTNLLGAFGGQAGDALMFRNRIINGDMRIDQRNNGTLLTNLGSVAATNYPVDRTTVFIGGAPTTGRLEAQRSTLAPSGFTNSLYTKVTTTDATPTSVTGYAIVQILEGHNISDFGFGAAGAQSITVSFWVRSSVIGDYVFSVNNNGHTRIYSQKYTINAANTWEYKTITIPGDVSGTWLTDNNTGLWAIWGLGGGSDRRASSLGVWQDNATGRATTNNTACVNFMATSGATFYITGVQLEAGPVATPFERRPIGVETQLCMRYFQTFGQGLAYPRFGMGLGQSTNVALIGAPLSVPMRLSIGAAGTSTTLVGNWLVTNFSSNWTVTSIAVDPLGSSSQYINLTTSLTPTTMTVGTPVIFTGNNDTNARIQVSAEL